MLDAGLARGDAVSFAMDAERHQGILTRCGKQLVFLHKKRDTNSRGHLR
jgi:hypothetical protein